MTSTIRNNISITGGDDEVDIDKSIFTLPERFKKFRKAQVEAAETTVNLLKSGVDIVVLEASVGFGKSLYFEMVRQMLSPVPKKDLIKMVYMAPKNELLKQMKESFPYADSIKGRSNYPHGGSTGSNDFKTGKANCSDCIKDSLCKGCGCLYKFDRELFVNSEKLGITNSKYFLAAANYLNMFDPNNFKKREAIIRKGDTPSTWIGGNHLTAIDEASSLSDDLLNFFEISITMKYLQEVKDRSGIKTPIPIPPVRDFSTWPIWWIDLMEFIENAVKFHGNPDPSNIREVRWIVRLNKLFLALKKVQLDWIYDPERERNSRGVSNGPAIKVTLKPLQVGESGKPNFWDYIGKGVAACGTIISVDVWAQETGLDLSGKTYQFIRYETDWNKWNRTIHRIPGFDVTKKSTQKWSDQTWWPDYIKKISWLINKYPSENMLIHAVSHELSKEIGKSLGEIYGSKILVSTSDIQQNQKPKGIFNGQAPSDEAETLHRDEALEEFKKSRGKVLISASLMRGTDLPDDLCRNLVIAKIPWKSLGDRRVRELLEKTSFGRMWYLVQAVRDLVQALGRGVRHRLDWCRIWILDDQFDRIIRMEGLLPNYIIKATREPGDYMSRH